jgi:hypothetical protein
LTVLSKMFHVEHFVGGKEPTTKNQELFAND